MSFESERIREIRTKLNMSQEEFGLKLGMSGAAVRKWESGQSIPYPKTLQKISEVTGKPIDWFLDEPGHWNHDESGGFKFEWDPQKGEELEQLLVQCVTYGDFTRNLKRARLESNRGLDEIIRELKATEEVDQELYLAWESGDAIPSIETLWNLQFVLNTTFPKLIAVKRQVHTRPPNADASSIPRLAPMPPSKAKHIRDARQRLRQARDVLATLNQELLEPNDDPAKLAMRGINKAQRDIIAALDELDKLMEG